jgi:hypothetical protein
MSFTYFLTDKLCAGRAWARWLLVAWIAISLCASIVSLVNGRKSPDATAFILVGSVFYVGIGLALFVSPAIRRFVQESNVSVG